MDPRTSMAVLLAGLLVFMVTCESAEVKDDASMLTELLRKANTVLDNIISRQKVADTHQPKEDISAHLEQRNEADVELTRTARWSDFLAMICKELQAHGLNDPSCDALGDTSEPERRDFEYKVADKRPIPERSIDDATQEEDNLERTAKGYVNVISEICDVFRAHGIIVDECVKEEERRPLAERSLGDQAYVYAERPERTYEEADEQALTAEISEPEPAPPMKDDKTDGDISLEKVLKYLQFLRSKNHKSE